MMGWILLVAGLAGAVFLAWRDEYRQKNDSLKQLESFRESRTINAARRGRTS